MRCARRTVHEHAHRATVGLEHARAQMEQRGLAGAVGPEQHDGLAALGAQVHAVERDATAPQLASRGQRDHGVTVTFARAGGDASWQRSRKRAHGTDNAWSPDAGWQG